ncbi:MAG TPA: nucleotidyltransferase family protein [Parafilimonas sp.]|nr:nucleotidyltransferase family protein [Parafilimonas sp.]
MNNTAIIILAAGNASRFGSAKQLLHFNNKTLLQHVVDEAVDAGGGSVIVVTGAYADKISESINNTRVEVVHNENWQQGMASGIAAGVNKAITLNNDVEKIILAVCDQPFVSSGLFNQLYQKQEEGVQHIVASSYADAIGTPALFTQKYFDALLSLTGNEGAKKIIKANTHDVASVDFPQGAIDIDTQKDFDDLLDRQKHVL